jgi:multidrug efflux pump subunit AcrA (membrane-fusion protein)
MINRYKTPLAITLVILIIVIIFLPIKYPSSINSKGKLLPHKTWLISKETDGRLTTELLDNVTGINNEFSVTQFERGDAVQFKFNLDLLTSGQVQQGDTIGYVISNEIEKDIEKLKGELNTARALLNVQTSSEKESVIEEEKSKLVFAEKELEEQTKIYERKKKLFDRDLISQQEFEADEAKYELAKININIAKERLRGVQSGAKTEEIDYASSQISTIENEISVLQKRYESNNIVSPISGMVTRSFSSDTLLIINDVSKSVALIPIKWQDSDKLKPKLQVVVSSPNVNESLKGKIFSIGNSVKKINGIQYIMVTALFDDGISELKPGLLVDCKIQIGDVTAMEILTDFFKPVLN